MRCAQRVVPVTAAAGLALAAGSLHAQVWNNNTGNNQWNNAQNWNPQGIPGAQATATIPAGFPAVQIQGGASVAGLNAMGPVNLVSNVLTVTGASTINGFTCGNAQVVSGGLFTMNGTGHVQTSLSWIVQGTGSYRNTGTLTVAALPLLGVVWVNTGVMNIQGTLGLGPTCVLMNNGLIDLKGNGQITSNGLITNENTLTKTGGASSTLAARVVNTATFAVQDGTLVVTGAAEFKGGAVAVLGQGLLRLGTPNGAPHKFNGGPTVSGAGTAEFEVIFSGASPPIQVLEDVTFQLSGTPGLHLKLGNLLLDGTMRNAANATCTNFTMQGAGEFHNMSGASFGIPAGGALGLSHSAIFANKGTLNMNGSVVIGAATFVNDTGGTVEWAGGVFQGSPSAGAVRNKATIRKPGGTGQVQVDYDQNEGGRLEMQGGDVTFTAGGDWGAGGGTFDLASPAVLALAGGTPFVVSGGTHQFTGAGRGVLAANTTLRVDAGELGLSLATNPTFTTGFRLMGGILGGPGMIRNTKDFFWEGGTIGVSDQSDFHNEQKVYLTGGVLRGLFTNKAGAEVEHKGSLAIHTPGKAVNNGAWFLTPAVNIAALIGSGGEFRNNANFIHVPPATQSANVNIKFDNPGAVSVIRGVLSFGGPVVQIQDGVLTGGTWQVFPGATLILPAPLTKIRGARVVGGRQNQQGIPVLPTVTEVSQGGVLEVNSDVTFNGQLNIENGGRLLVRAPATATTPMRLYSGWMKPLSRVGQTKQGEGPGEPRIVCLAFENGAIAQPGDAGAPGPFNLTGQYIQMTGGALEIDVGGPMPIDEHDRMDVAGSASLSGILRLSLLGAFAPTKGQSFTILTATGGITGQFATVEQPAGMPAGLEFTVLYHADSVELRVTDACYPDCNADGSLTVADFGCFQTAFVAGDAYADCNGDGVRGVADFGCFQTRFVVGCP